MVYSYFHGANAPVFRGCKKATAETATPHRPARPVQPRRQDRGRYRRSVHRIRQERGPEFFSMSPFDKARYERLLEGLEVTEIPFRTVMCETTTSRMDPEFFNREALR